MFVKVFTCSAIITTLISPLGALAQTSVAEDIPTGWSVVNEVSGDLTGDDVPETVLVIAQIDPTLIIENEGLGNPEIDTNPRALVVLSKADEDWREIARADGFVPPAGSLDAPCLIDPLSDGEIKIEDGKLIVQFSYWLSCGSYGVTTRRYNFRFENDRFRLIGFDRLEFSRSTGMGEEISINYLTSRRKRTLNVEIIGREEGDPPAPPSKVEWDRIDREVHFLEDMQISKCNDWDNLPSWC